MRLQFVEGRPVSHVTCAFLAWAAERLAADGVRVLVLVWDNAPWHVSREVRAWIRDHNGRPAQQLGLLVAVPTGAPGSTRSSPAGRTASAP